jgi:hypothetical protein
VPRSADPASRLSLVPTPTRARGAARWALLAAALGVAWLTTANPVPLYDGIGFPDEPYRFVPTRAGTPAATSAEVQLKVAGGSNTGGLIVNTRESGPQASVFAPPHAFLAAGTTPVTLSLRPLPAEPPLPGTAVSNIYELSLTSAAGPVTLDPQAQPPAITLRSTTPGPPAPVFAYRVGASEAWREIKTRRVGRDIFTAAAPGAGQYILVQLGKETDKKSSGGRGGLYAVLGATVLLMVAVIVGVRLLARRAAAE